MKKLLAGFALIILVLGLSACSQGSSGGQKDDKSIVIGRANDIVGLDPGYLTESAQVVDNIFETLVTRDKNEKLVPGLATSWKQVNAKTWEFKLRKGVKFTNGEKMNANAVKYSIDRVISSKSKAPTKSYISTIKEVKVVNANTVKVITKTEDPLIPVRFSRYPTEVVPPKYVEKVGQEKFAQKPVGTGPYKFSSWKKGSEVVLKVNKDYWGKAPEVKKVTFRSIPEAATRVSSLENGETDIITDVSPSQIKSIESSSKAKLSNVKRGGNIVYVGLKTNKGPLKDVRVRKALNYAVNVKTIVKNVLDNTAVATNSIYGPKDFGYAGEPKGYSYNVKKAKKLLKEAGYEKGFTIDLDTVNWYIKNTDVAQAIAEQLKAVNIKVKVHNIGNSVYRESVPNGKQSDMYVLGWSSTNSLDADAAAYAVFHSSSSYSTYSNKKVDKLFDEARSTSNDKKRKKLYAEVQSLIIKESPRIFLYQENKYYGISKKLNWSGRIDASIPVKTITFK